MILFFEGVVTAKFLEISAHRQEGIVCFFTHVYSWPAVPLPPLF